MGIVYFLITILATTMASLTGMGGGIIMKPVLDILGHFDTETISVLSSFSVFTTSFVSTIKNVINKNKFNMDIVIPLGIGAVFGGSLGQAMFNFCTSSFQNKSIITIVQNVIIGLLICFVFYYIKHKDNIPSKNLSGAFNSSLVGLSLGVVSSFLGIGGGSINVPIFIYLFSYDTKTATISSLVTIVFAQASKLMSVLTTTGFEMYDLSVLPYMVVAAVAGGFAGTKLSTGFSDKQIEKAFVFLLFVIFGLCVWNICGNILELSL